jgi:hypothetical protein
VAQQYSGLAKIFLSADFHYHRAMTSSSTAEQPKDERNSVISAATALSTPELKSTVETLQEMLQEREMQSYDFAREGFDKLVGLDKTEIKLALLKKPSKQYTRFVKEEGKIYPDKTKGWTFHVGSGKFEIQYAFQEDHIHAGTTLAQRSVFAFGPALLSEGFPEHEDSFSNQIQSGFGRLAKRLNEECGDVAAWKWDVEKAVELVGWAMALTGETDDNLNRAVSDIYDNGYDGEESEECDEGGEEDDGEEDEDDME